MRSGEFVWAVTALVAVASVALGVGLFAVSILRTAGAL